MRNLLFILGVLFANATYARWMLPSESDVVVLNRSVKVQVHENGTSTIETNQSVKILNERGRLDWGTWRFNYTPKNVKYEIVSAKSVTAGTTYVVDKSDIVDSQVNATENGFDEARQIVLPFSQVQVGTILHIVTKVEVFRPYMANHYSERYFFGDYNLLEKSDVQMKSVRPLYFQINDPLNVLSFSKSEDVKKKKFEYSIKLKKPVVTRVFEENEWFLPIEKVEWFAVSTAKSYPEMFGSMVERYKAVLDKDLPEKFESIVKDAKKIKDPIDQVNFVLATIADRVRYMGDWRSVDGAYVPRALQLVANTRFGDCKDLATLTAKILRLLGLKADVAFIYRGRNADTLPVIPIMAFNHAITTVELPNRRLWIDPTNYQAFAEGVFDDIADRKALVVSEAKMELMDVEYTPPNQNIQEWDWTTSLVPGQKRIDKFVLKVTGSEAIRSTGAELSYSKKRFEAETVANFANMSEVISYKFEPYDLRSRIVKPIRIAVTIEQTYQPTLTSMGPAIGFEALSDLTEITRVDRIKRVADLKLGVPSELHFVANLKNFKVKGNSLEDCKVKSPWIDYSFELTENKNRITRTFKTKKPYIRLDEIQSPEFALFQTELRKCSRGRYLVYE